VNENHSDKCVEYLTVSYLKYFIPQEKFKVILDRLITCTKKLPDAFYKFLAGIVEEGGRLPDDYFTEFELSRLQFSHYGALKDVLAWHSKILITGVVVIRMFLMRIFMKAESVLGVERVDLQEKFLNLGSFFYQLAMEYVRSLAPINKNQLNTEDSKVRPISKMLPAIGILSKISSSIRTS
jgi:hypothetical protein